MYSSEYEQEQEVSNKNSSGNFYQNNRVLVWIFIAIILIAIIVVVIKKSNDSTSNKANVNKYSISIYPETDVIVSPGNTSKLMAVVKENSNAKVTWASSDESIAKVADGTVTAVKYGQAVITATYTHTDKKNYTSKKQITVADGKKDVALNDVSIKDGSIVMPPSGTYNIPISVVPTDAYIFNKTFTSSNESVATVTDAGFVQAVGVGESNVVLSLNDGAITRSLRVIVNNDYTTSEMFVNPTKIILGKEVTSLKVGGTARLSYTVEPADAINTKVNWTSSDTNILTVDKNGSIEAIKEGKATVKVSAINGIEDSIEIVVASDVIAVTDIELYQNNLYIDKGMSETVRAVIVPEEATDKSISCVSSNPSVARIMSVNDSSCTIEGVIVGTSQVTIKSNSTPNVSKTINIVVSEPAKGGSSGGGSCGSCSKVTCAAGKYCSCGKCVVCPQGYYCGNNKKTACPDGKSSAAGSSSYQDCGACSVGYYLSNKKCVACPKGQTTAKAGATDKSACVDESTVVRCEAGKYKVGNTCKKCPTGYTSNKGATAESQCYKFVDSGQYLAVAKASTTVACQKGTYSSAKTIQYGRTSTCTPCPKGTYASSTGSSSCKKCQDGWFASSTGSITCSRCSSGKSTSDHTACITTY